MCKAIIDSRARSVAACCVMSPKKQCLPTKARACRWHCLAMTALTTLACAREAPLRPIEQRHAVATVPKATPQPIREWSHSFSLRGNLNELLALPDRSGGLVVVSPYDPIDFSFDSRYGTVLQAIAFDSSGRTRFTLPYPQHAEEATAACLDDDGVLVIAGYCCVEERDWHQSHECLYLERYDKRGRLLGRLEFPSKVSSLNAVFPMGNGRIGLVVMVNYEVRIGPHILADPRVSTKPKFIPALGTHFWVALDRNGNLLFSRSLGQRTLWIAPDASGVSFISNHINQQGTSPLCRTSGWDAERWSLEGERLWNQDLGTPLEFVLPRARGGFFAATPSCADPCRDRNSRPSCQDPRRVLLAVDEKGDIAERGILDGSLTSRLDSALDGLGSVVEVERLFPDDRTHQQSSLADLTGDAPWPSSFGAKGKLYPSTEHTIMIVHAAGGANVHEIEVARRALP
jgi:hypothetical protein